MSVRDRLLAFTILSRTKASATWEYDTAPDEFVAQIRCTGPKQRARSGDFDRCRVGNGDRIQQHKHRLAGVRWGSRFSEYRQL